MTDHPIIGRRVRVRVAQDAEPFAEGTLLAMEPMLKSDNVSSFLGTVFTILQASGGVMTFTQGCTWHLGESRVDPVFIDVLDD